MLSYEIGPHDVKAKIDAGERLLLLDVREVFERQICGIDAAHLIPMNTVPERLESIQSAAEEALVVVFCHHGVRSLSVVNWLRRQGVENCQSMAGGIERWSAEVDSTVPRY